MGRLSHRGVALAILLVGGALIGVLYWVIPALRPAKARVDPEADERARQERAARVCAETRARVVRGAVIGPTDVEGWVTELTLLRPAGGDRFSAERDLADVVTPGDAGRRLSWSDSPELSALAGSVQVTASEEQARPRLTLSFHGEYVTAYFREEQRPLWVSAAAALAKRARASEGALYARCRSGGSHHLGSWFLGMGPGGAATMLLHFMHAAAEGAPAAFALDQLAPRTKGVDRARLGVSLAPHGGMMKGAAQGPFELTFPFRDADRAVRASRDLARALAVPPPS